MSIASKRWNQRNPEKVRAAVYKYRDEHRDQINAYRRKLWHSLSDEEKIARAAKRRNQAFIRRYGITVEEYDLMKAAQNGVCKLCHHPTRKLDVDHCHETGAVRGLLCMQCNHALGILGDNVEGLKRALKYVQCQ